MRSWQVLWRRLDTKGMDACCISSGDDGWEIEGTSIFEDGTRVANLSYRLSCAGDWSTKAAEVRGWIGDDRLSIGIRKHSDDVWIANGRHVALTNGLLDVDLGFTPASNTNAIRRLNLDVGDEAQTVAVWLDTEDWTFKPLTQAYERISPTGFAYKSPAHNYEAELQVSGAGVVLDYPGLWKSERVSET